MKKWWIAVVAVLGFAITWAMVPRTPAVQVVSQDPRFAVYDVQYFSQTNRIHYWRAAWRDALNFVGLKKERAQSQALQLGPALVLYTSVISGPPPMLVNQVGSNMCEMESVEYFGSRCVEKYFCTLTNGLYHLRSLQGPRRDRTNIVDIAVNLKN